jgi:hypothetical protein
MMREAMGGTGRNVELQPVTHSIYIYEPTAARWHVRQRGAKFARQCASRKGSIHSAKWELWGRRSGVGFERSAKQGDRVHLEHHRGTLQYIAQSDAPDGGRTTCVCLWLPRERLRVGIVHFKKTVSMSSSRGIDLGAGCYEARHSTERLWGFHVG